ncbi:MAG: DUF3127 domain-containing protein [Paludibacteraceae bacterium]|nr:DUF3127 domain-containing protein [Paludibacteraceae bacterium]
MDIVGKIIQVLPVQEGVSKTGNPWKVQSYVLETQEQYPRKVCFEIFGEERIKNNLCNIDDLVTVSFDIESREFNGRWYTSIRAWRVQQGDQTAAQPAAQAAAQPVAAPAAAPAAAAPQPAAQPAPAANTQVFDASADDESGDLPF